MRGVGVSFNGLRSSGTNVLLNGAANNDEFTAAVGQTVPLDSVQEYSVLTNNFTSEFGRATSAVVNLVTKTVRTNFMDQRTNTIAYLHCRQKVSMIRQSATLRVTLPGTSLAGHSAAQSRRRNSSSLGMRSGTEFAARPIYGLHCGSILYRQLYGPSVQSVYQQLGKFRPGLQFIHANDVAFDPTKFCTGKPTSSSIIKTTAYNNLNGSYTCTSGGSVIGNNVVPSGVPFLDAVSYAVPADAGAGDPQNQLLVVGSVQWNISDKTSLTGTYALNKYNLFNGAINNSAYANYDTGENVMQNSFNLAVTHSFSTTTTMQNRLVFNRLSDLQPLGAAPITPVLYFNPTTTTTFNGNDVMMPGYNATTPGNAIPFGGPQNFIQYYQDWSKVLGRHTLRFGGSYNYIQDNRAFGAYEEPVGAFSTSGSFNWAGMNRLMGGYWGYYNGAVNPVGSYPCAFPIVGNNTGCYDASGNHVPSGEVALPVGQPDFTRSNRYQEFALYLADSWKATRKLTLSLGLRYEYFGTQHNVNPQLDSNYYFNGGGTNEFERIANGNVLIAPDSPGGKLWAPSWKNSRPKSPLRTTSKGMERRSSAVAIA